MPAERRALQHDVASALEIPDEPLCDDVGHERIRVVLALLALELQRGRQSAAASSSKAPAQTKGNLSGGAARGGTGVASTG